MNVKIGFEMSKEDLATLDDLVKESKASSRKDFFNDALILRYVLSLT